MADIRPTPEQRPVVGGLARLLQRADKFARAPFGYENPPAAMVSDFLSIPPLYRTLENYAYGSPLASGTSSVSRYLPKLTEDTKGAIEGAINLAPLVGPAARATTAGATALGRLGEQAAARAVPQIMERRGVGADLLSALASGTTSNVVKPKGGNWLASSIENKLVPLKSPDEEMAIQAVLRANPNIDREAARQFVAADSAVPPQNQAINRWIDTKLAKYIRNEMGTPEDPVRALAERGVLHFQPRGFRDASSAMDSVRINRGYGGFPLEDTATSPLAKQWERYADEAIQPVPSQTRVAGLELTGDFRAQKTLADNPWLKTLPRDTLVYEPGYRAFVDDEMLGFPHLIDELKAAMSPTSELPTNLRFDPKDIDKLTVPQAVERVSKINAWRAEQAAQAEKAGMMENLQAAPRLADENLQLSFVEKPGGAWVDIPETVNEKGIQLCTSIGKAGGWCTKNASLAKEYGAGHNRLTALIDAEGRPHAQAKITSIPSTGDIMDDMDDVIQSLSAAERKKFNRFLGSDDFDGDPEEAFDWLKNNLPEAYQRYISENAVAIPDITELKPPGNTFNSDRAREYAKRDPDYKAKVTGSVLNFLNSGEWGRVADLHHYDIVDLKDPNSLLEGMMTLYGDERAGSHRVGQEFIDAFNHAVAAEPNASRFMTQRQLREFIGPVEPLEGYAEGGYVQGYGVGGAVKSFAKLVRSYLAGEGKVAEAVAEAAPKEQKMLQGVYRGYAGEPGGEEALFASPQKSIADYYARRRAAETGQTPHAEMLLVDPFAGDQYGLSILLDRYNRDPNFTRARKLRPEDVVERTQLYAKGGAVDYDPDEIARLAASVVPGYAAGGLVDYDPTEIDTIVSKLKEEFHG